MPYQKPLVTRFGTFRELTQGRVPISDAIIPCDPTGPKCRS